MNCEFGKMDPAILRPGRLLALREFKPLPRGQADRLAKDLGKTLPPKQEYTLEEVSELLT